MKRPTSRFAASVQMLLAVTVIVALFVPLLGSGVAAVAPTGSDHGGYVYDAPPASTTPAPNTRAATRDATIGPAGALRPSTFSLALRRAAKGAPAVVRGGETAATAYGRAIHKTYDYGPGFRREFTLPSGRRADAVNLRTREVVELKPNNSRAISGGQRQLDAYASELDELYPGAPFTRRLETYDRP